MSLWPHNPSDNGNMKTCQFVVLSGCCGVFSRRPCQPTYGIYRWTPRMGPHAYPDLQELIWTHTACSLKSDKYAMHVLVLSSTNS